MRANKSGVIARGPAVLRPVLHSSRPPFLRPVAIGGAAAVLSFPARFVIITGLSLGLWLIVGLIVTRTF